MILGLGIDVVETARIEKMNLINEFIKKHFTDEERLLFTKSDKLNYHTLSNNFAGKEAFSKALGTGVRGFSLAEIEILRDGLGKPYINLYGKAKNAFGAMGGKNIHISISDTDNISTAVVIIEGWSYVYFIRYANKRDW